MRCASEEEAGGLGWLVEWISFVRPVTANAVREQRLEYWRSEAGQCMGAV